MTSYPFDPDRLPPDLKAIWDLGDLVAFERAAKAQVVPGETDPELVVAYGWAFLTNAETFLAFEEKDFQARCQPVLEAYDWVPNKPELLSNPDGANELHSKLIYAYKYASSF